MKVHATYVIKLFCSFGNNATDILIIYLQSSLSISTNTKTKPLLIRTITIQCAVYHLYWGAYCYYNRAVGRADWLMVTIAIEWSTVCTVGLTVSVTVQQVGQTDCWSLYQLCVLPSVLWGLMLVNGLQHFTQELGLESVKIVLTELVWRNFFYSRPSVEGKEISFLK